MTCDTPMPFIAYTDYPIISLGDLPRELATIRQVEVLAYDGNKYCTIRVGGSRGVIETVKSRYLYLEPRRVGEGPCLSHDALESLPTTYRNAANSTVSTS